MPLQPEDWNVVVAGRWNTALFTPAAISRRVFHLPEGTPVEVLVALDDIQMPRVKHDEITVAPSISQLVVAPDRCTFEQLARAMNIAKEAIAALPNTPYIAAGFNLRYRADDMPQPLTLRFSEDVDRRFSDHDFDIIGRLLNRSVRFDEGRLLVQVMHDLEGKSELLMNFERRSRDAGELQDWLSLPVGRVSDAASKVFTQVLQLQEEDYVIERDDHTSQQQGVSAASAD
jgi:hypothetical protein